MVPWSIFFQQFILQSIKQFSIRTIAGEALSTVANVQRIGRGIKNVATLAKSPKDIVSFGKTYFKDTIANPYLKAQKFLNLTPEERKKFIKKKSFQLFERNVLREIPTYSFFKRIYRKALAFIEERIRLHKKLLRMEKQRHKTQMRIYRLQKRILRQQLRDIQNEIRYQKKIARVAKKARLFYEKEQRRINREKQKRMKELTNEYLKERRKIFDIKFNEDLSKKIATLENEETAEVLEWDIYDFKEFENNYLNEQERKRLRDWIQVKGVHYKSEDNNYIQGRKDIGKESNYIKLNTKSMKFQSSWIQEASWVPLWVFMDSGKGYNMNYNNQRTRGFMKLKLKKSKRVKSSKNPSLIYVWWNISYGTFQKIIRDPNGTNFWKVFLKKNRKKLIYITIDSKYYRRKQVIRRDFDSTAKRTRRPELRVYYRG